MNDRICLESDALFIILIHPLENVNIVVPEKTDKGTLAGKRTFLYNEDCHLFDSGKDVD